MKIKAIVLDDDDSIRTLTSEILKDRGYDVCASSEPLFSPVYLNEECTCSDEHCSTIVITDINMPNLNGLEMLEQIQKLDKNVPAVIMSAYKELDYYQNAIELNVAGYIVKPTSVTDIVQKIDKKVIINLE
mgnify:CR=1 FL=1